MPDAIPIRRISGLPPASFRFHLAMDTLAIGCVLGATSCTRDFHPLERAHAGRTTDTDFSPPSRSEVRPKAARTIKAAKAVEAAAETVELSNPLPKLSEKSNPLPDPKSNPMPIVSEKFAVGSIDVP